MFNYSHLKLNELSKQDAVVVVAMSHGIVLLESEILGDYPFNNIVGQELVTANAAAISMMVNIFN